MQAAVPVPAPKRIDLRRVALRTVIGFAVLWAVSEFLVAAFFAPVGRDLELYQEAARRWLAGGGFYFSWELAGPYDSLAAGPILYPPVSLLLLVPSLILPAVLWWAIPLGATAWIVVGHHPTPWAWAVICLLIAFEPSVETIGAGNPGMWVMLAVALSTRYRWVAAFVLLKPSLFPLALFGIRSRRWWIVVALLGLVSLALLPVDLDWLRAMLNAQGSRSGLLYSLREVPLDCLPLVAYFGRQKVAPAPGGRIPAWSTRAASSRPLRDPSE